jgi:CBS domain-containing protein
VRDAVTLMLKDKIGALPVVDGGGSQWVITVCA